MFGYQLLAGRKLNSKQQRGFNNLEAREDGGDLFDCFSRSPPSFTFGLLQYLASQPVEQCNLVFCLSEVFKVLYACPQARIVDIDS